MIHNAAFDLAMLRPLGFAPGTVHDTMLLAQLLVAGTFDKCALADVVERELRLTLDKEERLSDWSAGKLTAEQLAYAARDAEVLVPVYRRLTSQAEVAGLEAVTLIEGDCLPALVWAATAGVGFDRCRWEVLASSARADAEKLREELNAAAPPKEDSLAFDAWNWDSPVETKAALAAAGVKVDDTADQTLAGIEHPLAALLRRYRDASKRASTYGQDWLKHVAPDGRVYPSWRQIGAASGRMSCSSPNMQQMPRGEYRRCVVAPPGRLLVKADYSQIELRIAAKVTGDQALLEAYEHNDDLHTRTARNVLGKAEVTKADRQLAKALNFGLLYGMGSKGFRQYARTQYGLDLTEDEAKSYRNAFFAAYPGLAAWHQRVRSRATTQTRTLAGRRRLLDVKTPDTQRLNTPVQGTGADGLKAALGLLWKRRDAVPGAFPVLIVHDEIVVECAEDLAATAVPWLKGAMIDGMAPLIAPVPVEVELTVARTWGGD